jgi:hypothetical protein
MNKAELAILEAKTPAEYIDRSLKAKLTPAAKARLARQWMAAKGYTKEDILGARNRHPYWKKKKMEGSADRTRRRLSSHNYSGGSTVNWDSKLVTEFLNLNGKDSEGRYLQKDWQLAERFGATIPSIQYMRRKLRKVQDILGSKAPPAKVVEYLLVAESVLARGKGAVEALKSSRSARSAESKATAAKAAAAKKVAPKAAAVKKGVAKKAPAVKAASPKKSAGKKAPAVKAVAKKVKAARFEGKAARKTAAAPVKPKTGKAVVRKATAAKPVAAKSGAAKKTAGKGKTGR